MKKILFVIGDMERGGAQRVVVNLANHYVDMNYEVHIAILLSNKQGYLLNSKVVCHVLTSKKNNYMTMLPELLIRLRRLIKTTNFCTIVSFVGRVNLITALAGLSSRSRIVYSERNDPEYDNRNHLEKKLCKILYRYYANRVVFQTNYQKQWYNMQNINSGYVIGNPIVMNAYLGTHNDDNFAAVGKLMPQKNYKLMLHSFKRVVDIYNKKKLYIYGSGFQEDELKELSIKLGLKKNIVFCGNIENIEDSLKKHRYFLMTSEYEGMPNALIEAMINGMVCISTNWNGSDEIISNNINGFISKNDVDSLTATILNVLKKDDDELDEISKNAIKFAESLKIENIIFKWDEVILYKTKRGK